MECKTFAGIKVVWSFCTGLGSPSCIERRGRMLQYRRLQSLTREEYDSIPDEYLEIRECVYCGTSYKECENIGRLGCRIHTGIIKHDIHTNSFLYNCCRRPYDAGGCVRSDHMDNELPQEEYEEEDKQKELEEWAILYLPTIFLQYGVDLPLSSTIIYQSTLYKKQVIYSIPVGGNKTKEGIIEPDKVRKLMIKQKKESPFLSTIYAEKNDCGIDREALNMGWKDTLNDKLEDDEEGEGKDIPYIIICRVK